MFWVLQFHDQYNRSITGRWQRSLSEAQLQRRTEMPEYRRVITRLLNDKPLSGSQQSPIIKIRREERTPLTRIFWPLTQFAAGLAKNEMMGAISSGRATCFCGCRLTMRLSTCLDFPPQNRSMSMGPDNTVLTVTSLQEPRSLASMRDTCSIAPLLATYVTALGNMVEAWVRDDDMKMRRPPRN
jgi:hypothetical protein